MSTDAPCYAARFPGMPGFGAVTMAGSPNDTAKTIADWIKRGATVEHVTVEQARAGLSEYLQERQRRKVEPAQGCLL